MINLQVYYEQMIANYYKSRI